jgi:hypothetical protein
MNSLSMLGNKQTKLYILLISPESLPEEVRLFKRTKKVSSNGEIHFSLTDRDRLRSTDSKL